jgi:ribosomal protein S18 acetylase RimI-like enzyme
MSLTLKQAYIGDLESLSNLVNSAYRGDSSKKGWTTEADLLGGQRTDPSLLKEILDDPKNIILLAHQNNVLVGCVLLEKKTDRAYLGMLTIKPELQGAGLGKYLLDESEKWVVKMWHLRHIEMTVIKQREELLLWYNRRGYINSGRKQPFPYGDEKFGVPKVPDLEFFVLEKKL